MPWGHVTGAWTAAQEEQEVEQKSSSVLQPSPVAESQENLQPGLHKCHRHEEKSYYSYNTDTALAPTTQELKHIQPAKPSSSLPDDSVEENPDVLQCDYMSGVAISGAAISGVAISGVASQQSAMGLHHSDDSVLLVADIGTDLKKNSHPLVQTKSEVTFSGQVIETPKPPTVTETRKGYTLPSSSCSNQNDTHTDILLRTCVGDWRKKLGKIASSSRASHTNAKERRLGVSCARKKLANHLDKEAVKQESKLKANQTANGLPQQAANGKNKRPARILHKRLARQLSKIQREEAQNDVAAESNDAVSGSIEVNKTREKSTLYCSQCDKTFSCRKTLRRHWQTSRAHGQRSSQKRYSRPYRPNRNLEEHYWQKDVELLGDLVHCKLCQRTLTSREDWRRHHREHRVRKTLCPVCGAKVENLRIHLLYHRSDKPHKCPYCPASFVLKHKLRDHVFTHTQEKNFCCEICGKSFRVKASLVRHSLVHSNKKPFKCEQCGDSFARNRGLKDHMRVHTGEKPYSCGVCGRKFASTGNLAAHRRKVHRLQPMVGGGTKKLILID